MILPYRIVGMTEDEFLGHLSDETVGDNVFAIDAETLEEAVKIIGSPSIECFDAIKSQLEIDDKSICLISNLTSEDMMKKVQNKLSSIEEVTKNTLESLLTTASSNDVSEEVNFVLKLLTAYPIPDDFEQTLLSGDSVCGGSCVDDSQTKSTTNVATGVNEESKESFINGFEDLKKILEKMESFEENLDRVHERLDIVLDETKSARSISDKLHQQINQTLPIESSYTASEMDEYTSRVISALADDEKIFDFISELFNRLLVIDGPQRIHTLDIIAQLISEITGVTIASGDE